MTLPANLAALARRVVGTLSNNLVALDAAGKLPAVDGSQLTGLRAIPPDIVVRQTAGSGVTGGGLTAGVWTVRPLNAVYRAAVPGMSLTSSKLLLPPGTYYAEWSASVFACRSHMSRLYNETAGVVIDYGGTEYAEPSNGMQSSSVGSASFTVSIATEVSLSTRVQTTRTSDGMGTPSTFGVAEKYAELKIWKVA